MFAYLFRQLLILLAAYTGRPVVSHDYLADLNAKALAAPEEDRAWPLYREAIFRIGPDGDIRPSAAIQQFEIQNIGPDDPLYPDAVDFIGRAQPALDLIREAGFKPAFGCPAGSTIDAVYGATDLRPTDIELFRDSTLDVFLMHLGQFRWMARLLRFEADDAVRCDDGRRAAENVVALVRLSRHAREYPSLINEMVSFAILQLAMDHVRLTLSNAPEVISTDDLRALQRELAGWRGDYPPLQIEGERATFLDLLQRTFSDDGHGSGVLTHAGWRAIDEELGITGLRGELEEMGARTWMALTIDACMPLMVLPRSEQQRMFEELQGRIEPAIVAPPWELEAHVDRIRDWECTVRTTQHMPVAVYVPAYAKAILASHRLRTLHDSTLVAIALELYKREHGGFPRSLAELAPASIESVPLDPFDGNPLRYTLVEGKPVLWSVGVDRKDDAARPPEAGIEQSKADQWCSPKEVSNLLADSTTRPFYDGDWILFPLPARHYPRSDEDPEFLAWQAEEAARMGDANPAESGE